MGHLARLMPVWLLLVPAVAAAQCPDTSTHRFTPREWVGSIRADSARLGALLGKCWGRTTLIRSSVPGAATDDVRFQLDVIAPTVSVRWNSALPFGVNDGVAWAGRGLNTTAAAGIQARLGRLRFTFDPIVTRSQNLPFLVPPSGNSDRSAYASPWHSGGMSADLPLRFGARPYLRVDPGESSLDYSWRGVTAGLASSTQWWGPGITNGLVLSSNAAGIPRFFVRSARPIATPLGDVEALGFIGGLTESPFFDYDTRNDLRSVSSAVVTLRLRADTGLTIGGARSVYAAARRFGRIPGHFADVFTDWHRQEAVAPTSQRSDQILSLFAQWRFPVSGFSMHGEWARLLLPGSVREILVEPQRSQGYVVGLEWATSSGPRALRVQAEATMLEQTPVDRQRDVPEFYASHSVPQGYTQQGQSLGAAIGPGSSNQYLGLDLFRSAWKWTWFAQRTRSEETAYYRTISGIAGRAHDIALSTGLGVGHDSRWVTWEASFTHTARLNYLFQTFTPYFRGNQFDIRNSSVAVRVTPRLGTR